MPTVSTCTLNTVRSVKPQQTNPLCIGQRIAYTARSNGVRYAGKVLGRLKGRSGWHVLLDCGETKDVEDAEAWRLVPS